MPPIDKPTQHHHHLHGGGIYNQVRRGSSAHSSTSSFSDDDDAITPCPLEATSSKQQPQQQSQPPPTHQRRPQNGVHRTNSWRDSIHGTPHHLEGLETAGPSEGNTVDVDAETLWCRMLAIQRVFGCYNSARMRAALEMDGDNSNSSGFIPSRTCLDLLNDSIDQLPEESKRQLEEFLETGETTRTSRSAKRRSWRQRLLHRQTLLNGF